MDFIDDIRKLAHFISVLDSQEKAGLVVEVFPEDPDNGEFQVILMFRIYLPQPVCIRGMRRRCGIGIDEYGYHFCTVCMLEPKLYRQYDECTVVFQSTASSGRILT